MGKPIPLSKEHKPHVPAESKRIKEAGGRVVVIEGISRVNGDIACSRAFGDAPLKNLIIPDPSCLNRQIKKVTSNCHHVSIQIPPSSARVPTRTKDGLPTRNNQLSLVLVSVPTRTKDDY